MATYQVLDGVEGPCLINCGESMRVYGPKPWGGGHLLANTKFRSVRDETAIKRFKKWLSGDRTERP